MNKNYHYTKNALNYQGYWVHAGIKHTVIINNVFNILVNHVCIYLYIFNYIYRYMLLSLYHDITYIKIRGGTWTAAQPNPT